MHFAKSIRFTGTVLALAAGAIVAAEENQSSTATEQAAKLAAQVATVLEKEGLATKDMPLAVASLANIGPKCQELKIGETVGELLVDALIKEKRVTVVDRANLKKLNQEMALGQTGLIDETTAAQVGNLLGARLMLTGSVMLVGSEFNIVAKIVAVETSEMVASVATTIGRTSLVAEASRTQPINKHPITAGFKSAIIPGWGQIENDQVAKGTVLMVLGGAVVAGGLYNELRLWTTKQLYSEESLANNAEALGNDLDMFKQVRLGILGGAGAVWAFSAIDAIVAAAIYNSRLSKGVAAREGQAPFVTVDARVMPYRMIAVNLDVPF